MLKVRLILSLVTVLFSLSIQAGTIVVGGPAVENSDRFEDFDIGISINQVSNEFAGNGLTFQTLSGNGISLIRDDLCGNSGGSSVSGEYLYMGVIPECSHSNPEVDAVSIQFDTQVTDLSWNGFNVANGAGFNIEALLNGVVVSSTVFDASNRFYDKTTHVRFSGSNFDEIRFSENGAGIFFAVDNMAWNVAVPAPGGLAVFAFGLLLMRLGRR